MIVIYGPSSRQTAHHCYPVLLYIGLVYFFNRILIPAHHNRRVVLPEHEKILGAIHIFDDVLFQSHIKIRVG